MDFIGFDLGKVSSQVCILTEDGELIERRIKTDRESFDKLFGERALARILVESSNRERVVRTPPRSARARGHRRGPELRADVRHPRQAY